MNFFGFPEYITDRPPVYYFRKNIIDNCKEDEIGGQFQN
jgi:hypothetical protein